MNALHTKKEDLVTLFDTFQVPLLLYKGSYSQ